MNSIVRAGRGLADLSDGTISSQTAIYCSLRKDKPTWPAPSTIAQDDAACARLWRDSAAMVGLPPRIAYAEFMVGSMLVPQSILPPQRAQETDRSQTRGAKWT
jgi:hypothetical protein